MVGSAVAGTDPRRLETARLAILSPGFRNDATGCTKVTGRNLGASVPVSSVDADRPIGTRTRLAVDERCFAGTDRQDGLGQLAESRLPCLQRTGV